MSQSITREEKYLSSIANGETSDLKPITRKEVFLAKASGANVAIPEPITREEKLLQKIALSGATGGSVILKPKEITANGEYVASADGADGFSRVVAKVPIPAKWDRSFTITGEPSEEGGSGGNIEVTKRFRSVIVCVEGMPAVGVDAVMATQNLWTCIDVDVLPTKTAENILVSDGLTEMYLYYIEDENDIFLYGAFFGADLDWMRLGAGLEDATFGGVITDKSQATEVGKYYALIEYIVPNYVE